IHRLGFRPAFLPDLHPEAAGGPRYLAVSTTALYGHPHSETSAAAHLRGLKPIGRTSTFLIFDLAASAHATAPPPRLRNLFSSRFPISLVLAISLALRRKPAPPRFAPGIATTRRHQDGKNQFNLAAPRPALPHSESPATYSPATGAVGRPHGANRHHGDH